MAFRWPDGFGARGLGVPLFLDMIKCDSFVELHACSGVWDVLFHGVEIDERCQAAASYAKGISSISVKVEYIPSEKVIIFDGNKRVECHELPEYLKRYEGSILFEATTLGIPELGLLFSSFFPFCGREHRIMYVEPGEYAHSGKSSSGALDFSLSAIRQGYEGVPMLSLELDSNSINKVVFFVGFESERLSSACEEQPITTSKSYLVFGVPPYFAGWEIRSYASNIRCLNEYDLNGYIRYCAADNPQAVIDVLMDIQSDVHDGERLFLAPIGSKPHGIGALIFLASRQFDIGLLFDHPVKKADRTSGVGSVHFYDICETHD